MTKKCVLAADLSLSSLFVRIAYVYRFDDTFACLILIDSTARFT